jgi:hypothetical protein
MEKVDSFIQHHPTLWTLAGDWEGTAFRRRMTVMKTTSGGLVLHSAIALPEERLKELDRFGKVEAIVVPNYFHDSDAPWFSGRFLDAKVFAPQSVVAKLQKRCSKTQVLPLESAWSATPWAKEIHCIPIQGLRLISESYFVHVPSETLVICDMAFNMKESAFKGAQKFFMRMNRIGRGFGPSRLATHVFTKNPKRAKQSYQQVLRYPFERVIVSHGEVIEQGGRKLFAAAFT